MPPICQCPITHAHGVGGFRFACKRGAGVVVPAQYSNNNHPPILQPTWQQPHKHILYTAHTERKTERLHLQAPMISGMAPLLTGTLEGQLAGCSCLFSIFAQNQDSDRHTDHNPSCGVGRQCARLLSCAYARLCPTRSEYGHAP